jgi:hypothetical protein
MKRQNEQGLELYLHSSIRLHGGTVTILPEYARKQNEMMCISSELVIAKKDSHLAVEETCVYQDYT